MICKKDSFRFLVLITMFFVWFFVKPVNHLCSPYFWLFLQFYSEHFLSNLFVLICRIGFVPVYFYVFEILFIMPWLWKPCVSSNSIWIFPIKEKLTQNNTQNIFNFFKLLISGVFLQSKHCLFDFSPLFQELSMFFCVCISYESLCSSSSYFFLWLLFNQH